MRIVPGWFCTPMTTISPSSTSSRVTTPSMGAVISVLSSWSRARVCSARPCATRRSPRRATVPRAPRAAAADATCALAPSALAMAASSSDCGVRPAARRSLARARMRPASAALRLGDVEVGLGRTPLVARAARVGFERAQRGRGRCRGTGRLHAVDTRQHLAGLHAVALVHREVDQPAHRARADVGIPRGDDFARRRHERLQRGDAGRRWPGRPRGRRDHDGGPSRRSRRWRGHQESGGCGATAWRKCILGRTIVTTGPRAAARRRGPSRASMRPT